MTRLPLHELAAGQGVGCAPWQIVGLQLKEVDMQEEMHGSGNWRGWLIGTPLGWGLSLAAAAAGVYLLVTHTGHVLGALPYLLLVACPLMHVFGHGHGSHRHHGDGDKK